MRTSVTSSDAQTLDLGEPPITYCSLMSEFSLSKIWTNEKPNLRTRWTIWLARLGIGVKRAKSIDDLFPELNS